MIKYTPSSAYNRIGMMGKIDKFSFSHLCDSCKLTCCESVDSPPVFPNDLKKLEKIGKATGEYLKYTDLGEGKIWISIKKKESSTQCKFFDNEKKNCTIYEDRPLDCKMYPFDIGFIDGEPWWYVYVCNPNSDWEWTEKHLEKLENDPYFYEVMEKLEHYYIYINKGFDDRSKKEIPLRKVRWTKHKKLNSESFKILKVVE